MKNLGVTYDNFLSQNLAKSKFTDLCRVIFPTLHSYFSKYD